MNLKVIKIVRNKRPRPKIMPIRALITSLIYIALIYIIFEFGWNISFAISITLIYIIITIPWTFNLIARKKLPPKNGGDNSGR
jgi:hypothetical protein